MSQSTVVGNVNIYVADGDGNPNPPVCLFGGDGFRGFSVELYLNKKRTHIKGLQVFDIGDALVASIGKVPA